MGGRTIPVKVVEYVKDHPVLSALGTGVVLHFVFRTAFRACLAWCAGEGLAWAQDLEPIATVAVQPTRTLPVGDLSWPAVLLAIGYMLRGWSPSITVRVVSAKDEP